MSKPNKKSDVKLSKSKQDKPMETKIADAAPPVVEPVVTTVADAPVVAPAAPATAPEAKPAPSTNTIEQNGIRQPGAGTLCRKVWDALDSLRADGKDATFDAVRLLVGTGMADATIRTQRQRWREFTGIKGEEKKSARKSDTQAAPAVVTQESQHQSA